MNLLISSLAGFLSGLIGSMGFGGGGVLIIYLVLFTQCGQLKAQGINLLFFIPCALLSVLIYAKRKQIKFKEIYLTVLGGICAAVPCAFLLRSIEAGLLSKIFGGFLAVYGIFSLIKCLKPAKT